MSLKPINQYSVDEVALWVECIGFNSATFKENAIDGDMLCSLTDEDFMTELGLSKLQVKKLNTKVKFTEELTSASRESSREGQADDGGAQVAALEKENQELKLELKDRRVIYQALTAPDPVSVPRPVTPTPAPQQTQHYHQSPPPPVRRGPGVVGGAATGAAGGAIKGAIVGAIVPGMSARDGASAGAAVGAFSGGVRGLRGRRRF